MTSAQITHVLQRYAEKLDELLAPGAVWSRLNNSPQLHYLWEMIPRFPDVDEDREKAMRWLCFMQGVFWSLGVYTVDELKDHNRAERQPPVAGLGT